MEQIQEATYPELQAMAKTTIKALEGLDIVPAVTRHECRRHHRC